MSNLLANEVSVFHTFLLPTNLSEVVRMEGRVDMGKMRRK